MFDGFNALERLGSLSLFNPYQSHPTWLMNRGRFGGIWDCEEGIKHSDDHSTYYQYHCCHDDDDGGGGGRGRGGGGDDDHF